MIHYLSALVTVGVAILGTSVGFIVGYRVGHHNSLVDDLKLLREGFDRGVQDARQKWKIRNGGEVPHPPEYFDLHGKRKDA